MIYWTYDPAGSETIIATLNVRRNRPEYNERLHLDAQSGSLTIKSLTTNDHGLYEMEVIRLQPLTQTFHLIIYAPVSVPNIRCITQSRSVDRLLTKESFSLVCSVKNGRDVILSWYRGEDIINQTSSRDPNITLYLPLEVKEGNETYRCVANNPVSKQTTKLRIEDHCQQHTGYIHSYFLSGVLIVVAFMTVIGLLVWIYWKESTLKHQESTGVIYADVLPAQKMSTSRSGGN
ncbi:SLAM family member 7-like [Esox lucius]|uniref:SLAM family member 7-like n=1 Tax=Esox lucius TaxID=8010 RepID=UPI000575E31C|nr:SLAM family member 7-like [Esox lucius]